MDYNKTWVDVIKSFLFQSHFEIAAKYSLYIEQIDIITVFFYNFLDENIFVNQPEGYIIDVILVYYL